MTEYVILEVFVAKFSSDSIFAHTVLSNCEPFPVDAVAGSQQRRRRKGRARRGRRRTHLALSLRLGRQRMSKGSRARPASYDYVEHCESYQRGFYAFQHLAPRFVGCGESPTLVPNLLSRFSTLRLGRITSTNGPDFLCASSDTACSDSFVVPSYLVDDSPSAGGNPLSRKLSYKTATNVFAAATS
jgi:hypothetical protein